MEIKQVASPNFRSGRSGKKIIAIVDHITAGAFPGCLNWLVNPQAQASAHYLVNQAGEIYQLVQDEDTAWHAGIVAKPNWPLYDGSNPNRYTLGIEHEGFDGTLSEAQYQATLWLHRQLTARWGIPVNRDHIIGHYRIDSVNRPNCPGPNFPWDRLLADLKQSPYPAVTVVAGGITLQGVIIDGYSHAPVAEFCRALGKTVSWDAATNTVLVQDYRGPAYAYTSYTKIAVGSQLIPATIINSRSYAPVRAVAFALGRQISWNAENKTATVS